MLIDTIYKNHPGLNPIYQKVFKRFPTLLEHIRQLEVCDRKGRVTLAIWLERDGFTEAEVAPYILKLFKDVVTEEQIITYKELNTLTIGSVLLLVNPDKFDNILRYYYQYDSSVFGKDITPDGKISKQKRYIIEDNKVITIHTYPNGDVKRTYAEQIRDVYGFPKCYLTLDRDDGAIYYLYLPIK